MGVRFGMVSLGCDKNRINAEQMLYRLCEAGHELVDIEELAEIVIVNTCAFIEAAKEEAIENILEIAELKKQGQVKKLLVSGCMAERYRREVLDEIPEVDGLIGCGSFDDIVEAFDRALAGEMPELFGDIDAPLVECPRIPTGEKHTAFLKIAEGCSNRCAYCVIPSIRGKYRSREADAIFEEAEALVEIGAKELILVAQDLTRYGADLYGKPALAELIERLETIEGLRWIRLHYLYPEGIDDGLIAAIAKSDKVVRYLDIPIQHISDTILKAMRRRSTKAQIEALFDKLRREIPGVVLRTSLICGLPGEGEAEFEELCAFLRAAKIERAGVFPYSPEEGTDAADMPRPEPDVAERRFEMLLELQAAVMDDFNDSLVGRTFTVLCDGYDKLVEHYHGRTEFDSPDVDGRIFFTSARELSPGDMPKVLVTGTLEGDLIGEVAD